MSFCQKSCKKTVNYLVMDNVCFSSVKKQVNFVTENTDESFEIENGTKSLQKNPEGFTFPDIQEDTAFSEILTERKLKHTYQLEAIIPNFEPNYPSLSKYVFNYSKGKRKLKKEGVKYVKNQLEYLSMWKLVFICILASFMQTCYSQPKNVRSPKYCDMENPFSKEEVIPEKLYIRDVSYPVTIATSRRPGHQLSTEIFATLLRQLLGYHEIEIYTITPESVTVEDDVSSIPYVYTALGQQDDYFYNAVPHYMIDLQVWANPAQYQPIAGYDSSTYIGGGARLGWFFPLSIIEADGSTRIQTSYWSTQSSSKYRDTLLEHWRTYTVKGGLHAKMFHRTQWELDGLRPLMRRHNGSYWCEETWCRNGMYSPPWCKSHEVCATLFASHSYLARDLPKHIMDEKLYVEVVFLGDALTADFVSSNLSLRGGRSILVYHYSPSLVLRRENWTNVAFPDCRFELKEVLYLCNYEMHRFMKYTWSKLPEHAAKISNAVEAFTLDSSQFDDILNEFSLVPNGTDINVLACNWIKKNQPVWVNWNLHKTKTELFIFGIFPISPSGNYSSVGRQKKFMRQTFIAPGIVPAFRMAVKALNDDKSLLQGYKLTEITMNGACEPDMVMASFIDAVNKYTRQNLLKHVVGIVGPACSDTIIPLAGVNKHYQIPIISYAAEGAIFTEENTYPLFFRTIPENKIFKELYLELFKQLNWRRIGSLTEDGQRYSEYIIPLHKLLEKHKFSFFVRKYRNEVEMNMEPHLRYFKDNRATAIIGDVYEDVARLIMCQAFRNRITAAQGFVWFLPMWYSAKWWLHEEVGCTREEMLMALEGHMTLAYQHFGEDEQRMQENITVGQWRRNYDAELERLNWMPSEYAGFAYDAVWSYGLAMQELINANTSYMADLTREKSLNATITALEKLSFSGVSGHLTFRNGHSRQSDVIVYQFVSGSYMRVGRFFVDKDNASNSRLQLSRLTWPGEPPRDKREYCAIEAVRELFGMNCTNTIILIGMAGLALLLIPSVVAAFIYRKRYHALDNADPEQLKLIEKLSHLEVSKAELVMNRSIGEGLCGLVYGGECFIRGQWAAVAVKMLKESRTSADEYAFWNEMSMMSTLQHENIVRLVGVCLKEPPTCAVFEYMLHGDLKKYLLNRRDMALSPGNGDNDDISPRRLTKMMRDLGRALVYLGSKKLVHRDLAARNVLVDVHKDIKLGDFGMARTVYENNAYQLVNKRSVPVRWMAPESIVDGVWNSATDVWSYAVVIYEVFTFCAWPFTQAMNNDQVVEYVGKHKNHVEIPLKCNPTLRTLLESCWREIPSRRPTAESIVKQFKRNPGIVEPCILNPLFSVEAGSNTQMMSPPRFLERNMDGHQKQATVMGLKLPQSMSGSGCGTSVFHTIGQTFLHKSFSSSKRRRASGSSVQTPNGDCNGRIAPQTGNAIDRHRSASASATSPRGDQEQQIGSLANTTIGGPQSMVLMENDDYYEQRFGISANGGNGDYYSARPRSCNSNDYYDKDDPSSNSTSFYEKNDRLSKTSSPISLSVSATVAEEKSSDLEDANYSSVIPVANCNVELGVSFMHGYEDSSGYEGSTGTNGSAGNQYVETNLLGRKPNCYNPNRHKVLGVLGDGRIVNPAQIELKACEDRDARDRMSNSSLASDSSTRDNTPVGSTNRIYWSGDNRRKSSLKRDRISNECETTPLRKRSVQFSSLADDSSNISDEIQYCEEEEGSMPLLPCKSPPRREEFALSPSKGGVTDKKSPRRDIKSRLS